MTDEKKAELRELLKPCSPEPSAAAYEALDAYWTELQKRYREAVSPVPTPDSIVVEPAEIMRAIRERAQELGYTADDGVAVSVVHLGRTY